MNTADVILYLVKELIAEKEKNIKLQEENKQNQKNQTNKTNRSNT